MNGVWTSSVASKRRAARSYNVCDAGGRDLRDAIHSADLYNWHDAEPKFSKARAELSEMSQSEQNSAGERWLSPRNHGAAKPAGTVEGAQRHSLYRARRSAAENVDLHSQR